MTDAMMNLRTLVEKTPDAERLRHDPAMRWIVGGKATLGYAASPFSFFVQRRMTSDSDHPAGE